MNFSLPSYVKYVLDTLSFNGFKAYLVGGCVRDFLLNIVPSDFDVTTNAKPNDIKNIFKNVSLYGEKHGTVGVIKDNKIVEVTTFRKDGCYLDSRHPQDVYFVDSLKEDLKRRDFTINAMAYNEKESLIDYFNGKNDIKNKIIRTVGEPKERFSEDALRMLRAVRFSAKLGFNIEENTYNAIKESYKSMKNISKERIQSEFSKILISDPKKIDYLISTGLIDYIIPYFKKVALVKQNNPYHVYDLYDHTIIACYNIENELYLRLTMLLHDIGKVETKTTDEKGISHFYNHPKVSSFLALNILKWLKYDNDTIDKVVKLVTYHDSFLDSKKVIKKVLNKLGLDLFKDLLKVQMADCMAQNLKMNEKRVKAVKNARFLLNEILEDKECFTLKDLNINGKDIINLGITDGKCIGKILNDVLNLVIKNPDLNNKDKIIKYIKVTYKL
ncbi:CCA tRNA nucleotidyltransferase [Clostridium sp. BJN0001]|uniref:CCA tRNA nucleotidyltransferase n=1 Tax=Clostridium sp. BJN0001 TaxID=2930219 RepID=UPI001FD0C879|nr:CCA tRNA nucleotidyltransferase [Clostridium sp. BJN0001]